LRYALAGPPLRSRATDPPCGGPRGHPRTFAGGRLKVLFLGDNGHHQPNDRAKSVLPVLTERGIDMFYTDDPADLNLETLSGYHALIFYNNHREISPEQLQALRGFVENGGGFIP